MPIEFDLEACTKIINVTDLEPISAAAASELAAALNQATANMLQRFKMNPHAFRHFAGYIFLKEYPGHYEEVRKLLGHKSITTTVRFYCGLEGESATIRFDKIIEEQRQTLGFGAPKQKPGAKARKTKGGRR